MRKALLIFGLAWVLLFCLLGVYLGIRYEGYLQETRKALEEQNFPRFFELQLSWKGKSSAHAHAICLSFLTLFVAILMPHMVLSGTMKILIEALLIVGTVLASIFGWIHISSVMAFRDVLVIVASLPALFGIIQGKME